MTSRPSLRVRLSESAPLQIMAAHSPLSAKLAEEAGFDGIWASGFELSALYGLPDASLLTMTQHLEMVRAMAERCALPIVADLDTGFGNAINVIYAIHQYEQAGVSAVVIEDKSFPKTTSLVEGGRQELVRVDEFVGIIAAAISARVNPELLMVARTEALIANLGMDEALRRAEAYAAAGADLVLVHSKQKTADEIETFARRWNGRVPLVIVPTSYPEMTVERARALGNIKMIIYGNHAIRAAVTAMKATFARIRADGGIQSLGNSIVGVDEIFRLQDMAALQRDEIKFLR